MVITINLLPNIDKEKKREARQNARTLTLCSLIIACLITASAVLYIYLTTLRSDQQIISRDIQGLGNQQSAFNNIKSQMAIVSSRLDYVQKLEKASPSWQDFINYFSSTVPDGIQVTGLKTSSIPYPNIEITGQALSRPEILKFESKLKSDKYFSQVTLKSLDLTGTPPNQTASFTITARFKPGSNK